MCRSRGAGRDGGAGADVGQTCRNFTGKRQVDRWGGQDLNLRPTDYESAALTN
jgi:hypothetical protein